MATRPKKRKSFPIILILDTLTDLAALTARPPGREWNPPYPVGTKAFVEEYGLFYDIDKEGNATTSDKEGGHTIEADNVSVPTRSILNFVGSNFVITDTGTKTEVQVTSNVKYLQVVTHADLVTLVNGASLEPGHQYLIIDFATRHIIPQTVDVNIGTTEGLIVTAISTSLLDYRAKSTSYPKDIIHYELVDSSTEGGDKGRIYYRENPVANISTHYDWRNVKFRRFRNAQVLSLVIVTVGQPGYPAPNIFIYGGIVTGSISGAVGYMVGGAAGFLRVVNHSGLFVGGDVLSVDGIVTPRTINTVSDYAIGTDTYVSNGRASTDVYTFVTSDATGMSNINIGRVGSFGPTDLLSNITMGASCSNIKLVDNCYNAALYTSTYLVSHGSFYNNYITGSSNNTFFGSVTGNKLYGEFRYNNLMGAFDNNVTAYGFTYNDTFGQFNSNSFARNFSFNTSKLLFNNNIVNTADMKFNQLDAYIDSQTFLLTATAVGTATESKRIIKGNDGILYLEYFNGVALVYVDPLTA